MNVAGTGGINQVQTQTKDHQILGKDDFLKLLTTQLRYQDPIDPVDDKDFVAQLAQFSSLEQIQNLNEAMLSFIQQQQQMNQFGNAAALIGRDVEIHSGEDVVFGSVTGVQIVQGWPKVIVDGMPYEFADVVSILERSF